MSLTDILVGRDAALRRPLSGAFPPAAGQLSRSAGDQGDSASALSLPGMVCELHDSGWKLVGRCCRAAQLNCNYRRHGSVALPDGSPQGLAIRKHCRWSK